MGLKKRNLKQQVLLAYFERAKVRRQTTLCSGGQTTLCSSRAAALLMYARRG